MRSWWSVTLVGFALCASGCGGLGQHAAARPAPSATRSLTPSRPTPTPTPSRDSGSAGPTATVPTQPAVPDHHRRTDINFLVNKTHGLPGGYQPARLVEPDVRFLTSEPHDKRKLRPVAAGALETLFSAAATAGVPLSAVSGYRTHDTQHELYYRYVATHGEEKANTFSARPGHSEHQTGLTMDVTTADGRCAADDCFGLTPAAHWLAAHAQDYGFIVRYPPGKELITGYKHEPWHLRYLGVTLATAVHASGLTYDEYYAAHLE
jgi:D-alanyl-D-alanine carboxypeptidase